ncbi:MAG: RidA family protein [Tissierellia bacterium]|nr:RidA family protein [Bacillota bacterium]NLL22535.1 RidA family protein [Tissierellia bacterium]
MKIIFSDKAPAAIGPYAHAVEAGNFLYLSGQLPVNPDSGKIDAEDIVGQAEQVFANIEAVLAEAGYSKNNVVKSTVFMTDMANFAEVNKVYAEFYDPHKPARSAFAVKELPMKALVEIETIAFKG